MMLLNVDRPMVNGDKNEKEPQQVQLWISSAGDKNTFSYDKTIEFLEQSIIQPSKFFCWGFDWRIPVLTGLLSKDYLNELRLSPTFNELGFAKEYMSRFVGGSNEAWFDYEKLYSARSLVNPETHYAIKQGQDAYYIISVDLGRRDCQSVATILKVFPNKELGYNINLVNLYILGKTEEEKQFNNQVIELKRLIEAFSPKTVVIDINGLGIAFADLMIKETWDPSQQKMLPPYGFMNREEYLPLQPKKCEKLLYGLKANVQINSDMHSSLYSKVYSGRLHFLIAEQDAKNKMLSTRKGQRLSPEEKNARLLPHQLTSLLINEIMNLRVKTGSVYNQIAIERINDKIMKDKFSAIEMGVYYIVQEEQQAMAKRRNRGMKRSLVFATAGRGGGERK